ncbi:MAG: rod shape-determining protein RodA [Cytophagales bacterium]|nr:rod shape-determining protein RodA [Cytophagales bacterium]MCA6365844.1 rod shape-determining protein RodA [Cytophagales bacterium]MCA6371240.1 rod shape-determining protein RodA [Cytophagales bacterium]MCA6374993.1 rod shape-determining protein RodA [Cytophagales bacterium]MCA6382698.1 rod shape-determining protein RodA [Cytophagales bacterium]
MRREDDISVKLDWTTILLFVALVTLGWLNIFAAIYDETADQTIWDLSLSSGRQLMFIAAAAVIVIMIIIIDMRFYETFAYLFYGLILVLLFLVPLIGKEVGGNKAWIGVGSFGVQPSEFAKFITALAVAKYIGSVGFRMDNLRNQAVLFALIGVPIILIQLQKDTGTALVFTSFVLVFYREGMSPFLLIVGVCAATIFVLTLLIPNPLYLHAAIAIILILLISFGKKKFKRIAILVIGALLISGVIVSVDYVVNNVLKPHQQNRVKVLVNPDIDPLGVGWNVTQSKIAIGSGGLNGKGFLRGTQTKFDFVPKQSTDFIFCTIGEEFGWIGSLVVIGLFVALLLRVIFLAERQKSRFARAYGYSVACILFFHFAINISMTVGLFPVIGIPLPFFSYGGSSLWGFTILLFVLLKLDAHRSQVLQRV